MIVRLFEVLWQQILDWLQMILEMIMAFLNFFGG